MSAEDNLLEIGATVSIKGLVSMAEHNGSKGKLVTYNTEKGRWGVQLETTGQVLGVKPANMDFVSAAPSVINQIAAEEDDGGLGVMKRKFDRVVKKYGLFSEEKSGEIADILTGSMGRQTISAKDFAEKYGMKGSEAVDFLAWIQRGIEFKEAALDPHNKTES